MSRANRSSRRHVLQAAAAGVAVLASGCTSVPGPAKPHVVVVGGGWGGLGAVRRLAEGGKVEVTLIEPNEGFMSCPMSALYIAGFQPVTFLQRSYEAVDRLGIKRLRERVQGIDRAKSQVVTATQRLNYDYLVLALGVEYIEDGVQGYAAARAQLPVGFRAFEQIAVRQQVDEFLVKGGEFVISAPKPPYRCPPAPYERACLIAEQMQRRATKGKIIFLDANAAPTPAPIANPLLNAMKLYSKQIEYLPNTEITAVDIGKRSLQTSMGSVAFQHANLVLPMRAPGLIRQAGLGERWAAVKLPSFQAAADDKIYVVGDAQGSPLPKSGHVAFNAGRQVGGEILERVAGKAIAAPTAAVALPPGICWAKVTEKEAININVTSSIAPGEAAKLKFTVDEVHNANSGTLAHNWANGMWTAMLG